MRIRYGLIGTINGAGAVLKEKTGCRTAAWAAIEPHQEGGKVRVRPCLKEPESMQISTVETYDDFCINHTDQKKRCRVSEISK